MSGTSRSVHRAQLTKLCNSVEDYLSTSENDAEKLKTLGIFKMRVKNAHERLLTADKAYESLIPNDELQRECEAMLEYDDRAVTVLAKIEHEIQKASTLNVLQRQVSPVTTESAGAVSHTTSEHFSIKLKPIELKKFDGNYENWLPFWEQFKTAVHNNPELNFVSKFNFLSTSLTGKAAASITGFLPTEQCYTDAIKLLLDEYGNNEKIIERYVQKLLTLKAVGHTNDVVGLRNLYNETRAAMRSLSALNVQPQQYEIMIKSVILQALPAKLRLDFIKTTKRSVDNAVDNEVRSLLNFLQNEVESLEVSNLSDKSKRDDQENHKKANDNFNRNKVKYSGSAVALYVPNKNEIKQCLFCKSDNHKTHTCTEKISINDKKEILKRNGRCFKCANKNHMSKYCKAQWIKCNYCNGRHITALCERKSNETIKEADQVNNVNTTLNAIELAQNGTYLQTLKVIFCSDNNNILTRCVMDNGSQRSYVSKQIVKKLKLPIIAHEKSCIMVFGEDNKTKKLSILKRVQLKLKSQYSNEMIVIEATVVPNICSDILPVPIIKSKEYKFISDRLADKIVCNENLLEGINLLIGQDNIWKINKNENEIIGENLMATNTIFGWTIQGCHKATENASLVFNVIEQEKFDVTNFWNLESIGIKANTNECVDVVPAIKFENNRYIVKLPWRKLNVKLDTNFDTAKIRLFSLTQKLLKNGKMLEYHEGMMEMIKNDIAEVSPVATNSDNTYYMPHRPVYREDHTTTKMRIVFDASSSKPDCLSLNEHLYPGTNFCGDLFTNLLNFRSKNVAICADIEKAFLQIIVDENDRDAQRFLWYDKTPIGSYNLPQIVQYRMKRVTFGVTSSPYLLALTIKNHLSLYESEYPDVCEILKHSFYVDDLVTSVNTVEEAFDLYKTSKQIMNFANFKLRKWVTNNSQLNSIFMNNSEGCAGTNHKVLGLIWSTNDDKIYINLEETIDYILNLPFTKRGVMKAMGKIYDPLGFLSPFTVKIKIILQCTWIREFEWDQELTEDLKKMFEDWRIELKFLIQLSFPRCITNNLKSKHELHLFADASPKAYGVVAYIREVSEDINNRVTLICSKNRVSPINKSKENELTLPKLELTAALIAARLSKFLITNMNINFDKVYLWTDSSITLYWITGNKAKKSIQNYVKARVHEINQITNIYDWRHCSGRENPADLITRGMQIKKFINAKAWQEGPDWLSKNSNEWPCSKIEICMNIAEEVEKTKEKLEPILEISAYSSINHLMRVTAYVLKFIACIKNQNQNKKDNNKNDQLTIKELKAAEIYWLKHEQKLYFEKEVTLLEKSKPIPKASKILSLNPILIDGILRLKSRLNHEKMLIGHEMPIILPKQSILTKLLIAEAHTLLLHGGVGHILTHLRKKYWVIQGRQIIKTIINKCIICKRLHGKSANEPWTNLPLERINVSRPFENVGVDFAGPLYVKENETNLKKVYIFLFTCAAVRAVHLELITDMTVTSCINGIKRFIARRGIPKTIMSDNAKTFKRAELEINKLKSLLQQNEVKRNFIKMEVTWKNIPERAAWWGGFWERLVKNVKTCLKSAIGKHTLNIDEMHTLLTEVEGVINSRPLTYVSSDTADIEPLTPSHFLNFKSTLNFDTEFNIDHTTICEIWVQRQAILRKFIKRWRTEYLHQLRSIHQNKCGPIRSIQQGDVVIIEDEHKPRLYWKLAVVDKIYPGRDGRTRACDLHLGSGKYMKRPIQLLYPLEISSAMAGRQDVKNKTQ